ncbi:stress response RCI peptide [Thermoascus aurantiacus ATCC 26904]
MCGSDIFLAILAVFFPPIAVWIKVGICTADSIINLALCCLGYVPGLLHSWYIILKYPEPPFEGYEPLEGGRVTYYYVSHQPPAGPHPAQRGYGAFEPSQPQPPHVPSGTRPAPPPQQYDAGAGSSDQPTRPPPTYAEAVKGDYKIQTQD